MRRTLRLLCWILFFITVFVPGFLQAQEVQAVDSLFFRGVTAYRDGRYLEALQMMEFLDRVYPNHPRTTGSLLMQGKSLYKLGNYYRSLDAFEKIVEEYPESQYLDDAVYGMATAFYRLNSYKDAVKRLLEVVERGGDKRLLRKAAKLSSEIMDRRMVERDLKELLREVLGERGKAAVTLRLAQREIDRQHFQAAKKTLQDFLNIYPKSPYVFQMEQLLRRAEELGKDFLKVGIILPLTGPLSEQGNGLLKGIQYAVDRHNEGGGAKVELVVRDSEGRILQAIKAAQELCEDEEILAIIGELESDLTAAVGAVAQEKGVVLLAPTATEDGLTSLGNYVFQLNSSLSVRGEMLAEYGVVNQGLKRFAVLAPADEYGKSMRDAFTQKLTHLGAEVLVEKWYFEGAKDLGPQFKAIREAGIRQMIEDSLLVIVPEEEYEEEYTEQGEVLYVKQTVPELVDSTELAVTSIEGIFFPVYGEDIPYVAPQLAFYNIDARIFGGAYWNDVEILEDHRRYVDGVVFLSDYYVDPSNFRYYRFRNEYRKAMGKTPEKMEIYGYDTATLLLTVAGARSLPRGQIRDQLARIRNFDGIRGTISFNEDRVNPSLYLLRYRGGNILRIK